VRGQKWKKKKKMRTNKKVSQGVGGLTQFFFNFSTFSRCRFFHTFQKKLKSISDFKIYISVNYSKRKIEMNCGQQIGSSQKSEISMEQQIKNQNRQAVVKNEFHKFKTTAQASETARTMTEIMKTNKADLGMYSVMWAEKYDEAAWYKAREEYLMRRVAELEESKKDLEERMDYLQEKHEAVFKDVMDFANRDLEYGCSVCGHKFADVDDWSGDCDENGCRYCHDSDDEEEEEEEEGEINWDEDAHSELCSAIDASGNALF
jgi:hypothetical protein